MLTLATGSARSAIRRNLFLMLFAWSGSLHAAQPTSAEWFPDRPTFRHYAWEEQPCPGCKVLVPQHAWNRMAALAGLPKVQFKAAADESGGDAYSLAPDVVVLSPAALKLRRCQLAFLVGHEIVHIAQRHFDEDAIALSVYSGKPADWTRQGNEAMELVDGDFGLALRVSHLWQQQEQEADWLGALLAAQACGCSIESGAIAYFRQDPGSGGGMAAAHAAGMERIRQLTPFTESAQRLAAQANR
jgi:Zn-dependent protease with chaperone function